MSNIGVVTFSNTFDNYGQVLQFLATKEYLEGRGHTVYLIREKKKVSAVLLRCIREFKASLGKLVRLCLGKNEKTPNMLYEQWERVILKNEKEHPRHFEDFRKENFRIIDNSKRQLTSHNIDCLCLGSDQIWSFVSDYNFLGFGSDDMKRISIAPGMGLLTITEEKRARIANYLKGFDFVTTREESGVKICQEAGYMGARKILDPTMLIDSNTYMQYGKTYSDSDYIFVYLLGAECGVGISDIRKFALSHHLYIKYVASQGREDNYKDKIYATVPEWIGLMRNARYVITNSFHGMALSVIFRKKFLVLPVLGATSKMNERITNFTSELGLENRIYRSNLDEIFEDLDYSTAEIGIMKNRKILNKLMEKSGL